MQEECLNHPLLVGNRNPTQIEQGEEQVPVRLLTLGESSVNLRAWAWAKDTADAFITGCDLLESIKKRFELEGIEIPYSHRTLVYKEPKTI